MSQMIFFWLNSNVSQISYSPFLFGLFCGGALGGSFNVSSFISVRRLIVQGIPAGLISFLGSAISETIFLFFILFGSLNFIDNWIIWEPTIRLIVTIFCLDTILSFLLDNRLKVISFSQKTDLIKIFLSSALIMFSNPASLWSTSNLIISIETFEFRENIFFLFGLFIGIFSISSFLGLIILTITHFWIKSSNKGFKSLLFKLNNIISISSLTILFITIIYYHSDVYLASSFSSWLKPLKTSPSFEFTEDVESVRALSRYKTKIDLKNQPGRMKTLGGLPLQKFEQWYRKQIKESKDSDSQLIPSRKTENGKYIPDYQNMLKTRDKKWFSRSEMYQNLKNKILSLFQKTSENIEFYQNSSFDDPSYTLPGRVTSPYLADKPSKRIVIRTLSNAERKNIFDERQNRLNNYLSKTIEDNLANLRNH
jgi:hypothetical protein